MKVKEKPLSSLTLQQAQTIIDAALKKSREAGYQPMAIAVLDAAGIQYESMRRTGDPAHEIIRVANEWSADVIALGRHGHGGMIAILLGSVAQKVIATSHVPVLLVD